jgi:NhaP-type Na+/H+ or K+/H+ antiporter
MTMEFIAMVLGSASGILATWVKMTNDVTKIKARLFSLEKQETQVQKTLDTLLEGVNEIKLLLAKKGIE